MSLVELQIDADSGIATLTVNRPQVLNAIDVPTARAFHVATMELDAVPGVRCIVLRGAGRAFVAGGDLSRFAEDFDRAADVVDELLDALHPAIRTLRNHDAPVLGSVHGAVAGAGLSLMAACDLVVAAEGTKFLLAYDRISAAPDCGGTWFLPRLLGPRVAAELMFLSETWDAETAMAKGLINRIAYFDGLNLVTNGLAKQLAAGPTRAFGMYKRLAGRALHQALDEHLEQERAAFKAATKTADFRAGVSAFLSRKTPDFSGH